MLQTELTPEQAEALPKFRAEWFGWGANTDRADRKKAEAAILAMRAEIGVKVERPIFVWCESPATSLIALHVLNSQEWVTFVERLRKKPYEKLQEAGVDRSSLESSLWSSLEPSLESSLRSSLG